MYAHVEIEGVCLPCHACVCVCVCMCVWCTSEDVGVHWLSAELMHLGRVLIWWTRFVSFNMFIRTCSLSGFYSYLGLPAYRYSYVILN